MKELDSVLNTLHQAIEETREAILAEVLGVKVCSCCQRKHYGVPFDARPGELAGHHYVMWECECHNTLSRFDNEEAA